jgi:hypothetical protein
MGVRKNQNSLTVPEKARFVAAVRKMKADSALPHGYNKYVTTHETAFNNPADDNPAHSGPAFFPWHRWFILKFEDDLKTADQALGGDGSLTLPYWDWTHDNGDGPGAQRGEIWKDDFMGGSGSPVTTGPFRQGQWALVDGTPLVRALGRSSIFPFGSPPLPEKSHVETAMGLEGFDTPNWDQSPVEGPSLATPPAPTVGAIAGGGLAAGTYLVSITHLNARGETRPSAESRVTVAANGSIRVTSPPGQDSATGFNIYVTAAGGATNTGTLQGGPRPFGAPVTIATIAAGSALPTINTTGSMRNFVEGFTGPGMHNNVHIWTGGSMVPGTAPNDPIFFLHHCNVDRLWALWQFRHPGQNYPLLVPKVASAGFRPHGLNDAMPSLPGGGVIRPSDVLNHTSLGYSYDTDPVGASISVSS